MKKVRFNSSSRRILILEYVLQGDIPLRNSFRYFGKQAPRDGNVALYPRKYSMDYERAVNLPWSRRKPINIALSCLEREDAIKLTCYNEVLQLSSATALISLRTI